MVTPLFFRVTQTDGVCDSIRARETDRWTDGVCDSIRARETDRWTDITSHTVTRLLLSLTVMFSTNKQTE